MVSPKMVAHWNGNGVLDIFTMALHFWAPWLKHGKIVSDKEDNNSLIHNKVVAEL